MAELPPNLDDGELWVPSGILPNRKISDKIKHGEEEEEKFPSELTYMEELAQQLSSNALLHQQQTKTKTQTQTQTQTQTNITKLPNPKLQVEVKPFIQTGSFQPNQAVLSVVSNVGHGGRVRGTGVVHSVYASDRGGYRVEMIPRYHLPPAIPTIAITQGNNNFVQARGGEVYHKQLNQVRNSFLPFQANVGGFVKGTGVFFPRVEASATESKKKQGVKNEENQCRMPVKKNAKNAVGKKEVKGPSGIVLPQEWTY